MWKIQAGVESPNKMLSSVLAPGLEFDDKVVSNFSSQLYLTYQYIWAQLLLFHTCARVIDLSCSASRDFFKLSINSCVPRCPSPGWQNNRIPQELGKRSKTLITALCRDGGTPPPPPSPHHGKRPAKKLTEKNHGKGGYPPPHHGHLPWLGFLNPEFPFFVSYVSSTAPFSNHLLRLSNEEWI